MAIAQDLGIETLVTVPRKPASAQATHPGYNVEHCTYDPEKDTWLGGGANVQPRQNHEAVALPDQRVLITGGWGGPNVGQLAAAEILDLEAVAWKAAAPMASEKSGHSMTVLPDGRVLVVGGALGGDQFGPDGAGGILHSVEIFDLGPS